ncbi:hypothetical protein BO71DRAFT_102015 [Aspergillus ellipticus CBS 707.79]|uniref:Uncharacterized protein n=1 Tax=Aspergillus ellipticus CBS 707.79 TaxID=1448320 RepID=A0A319EAQ8_9EURO|nr:hypothetical protein BO71DRAFT_102015 [Aspergillus ellipticus CBS 707.79]
MIPDKLSPRVYRESRYPRSHESQAEFEPIGQLAHLHRWGAAILQSVEGLSKSCCSVLHPDRLCSPSRPLGCCPLQNSICPRPHAKYVESSLGIIQRNVKHDRLVVRQKKLRGRYEGYQWNTQAAALLKHKPGQACHSHPHTYGGRNRLVRRLQAIIIARSPP